MFKKMETYSKKELEEIEEENKFIFNEFKKKEKTKKNKFNNLRNKINDVIKNKIKKYDINSIINKENSKDKIKKPRNPGVDLLRFIAMYIVVLHHILYFGNAFKHFPQYTRQLYMLSSITSWHNNAFILISGVIGYKTNKYSNLLYLWLTVFFYSVGIHEYYLCFKKDFKVGNLINEE